MECDFLLLQLVQYIPRYLFFARGLIDITCCASIIKSYGGALLDELIAGKSGEMILTRGKVISDVGVILLDSFTAL